MRVPSQVDEVMLRNRDAHMHQKLELLARGGAGGRAGGASSAPAGRVVAVVGVAHMDGLEQRWAETFGAASVTPLGDGT